MSKRFVATTVDGFVCSTLVGWGWSWGHPWVDQHLDHGCTVSTIPPDEELPAPSERWTPPPDREAAS